MFVWWSGWVFPTRSQRDVIKLSTSARLNSKTFKRVSITNTPAVRKVSLSQHEMLRKCGQTFRPPPRHGRHHWCPRWVEACLGGWRCAVQKDLVEDLALNKFPLFCFFLQNFITSHLLPKCRHLAKRVQCYSDPYFIFVTTVMNGALFRWGNCTFSVEKTWAKREKGQIWSMLR